METNESISVAFMRSFTRVLLEQRMKKNVPIDFFSISSGDIRLPHEKFNKKELSIYNRNCFVKCFPYHA